MKKVLSMLVIASIMFTAPLFALGSDPVVGLSIINSNSVGCLGIGLGGARGTGAIGLYSDAFDLELGLSHVTDDLIMGDSKLTFVSLALALKSMLAANTYLTYGLMGSMVMGSLMENDIRSLTVYGLFLGLQAELTANLLLSARWFPIKVSSIELDGCPLVTKTTGLGTAVDIGLTYLVNK
ncbi:hypothetical protein ACFL96_01610 [Thermoproteota archaeon]